MHEDLDTLLLLTGLTEKQADSITKYIIRQQENDRFPYCQARKINRSEVSKTDGVSYVSFYGDF